MNYYRSHRAHGGIMIVQNCCTILYIWERRRRSEAREAYGFDQPLAVRARDAAGASQPRGAGRATDASHARGRDDRATPRAAATPRIRSHRARAWSFLPVLVCDRAGQQRTPARRELLSL